MADLVLFGTGDIARLAAHYFETDSDHRVAAFTVDDGYSAEESFEGRPLVRFSEVERLYDPADYGFFVAVSYAQMNRLRADRCRAARAKGYRLVSYVSSRCTYLSAHRPGENSFILEDNTVQPFVRIGDHVTLWSGNHLGHDSVIEDDCFVSSHVVISGHCRVGAGSFLGVNSTLQHGVSVGARTVVGAGALVTRDVEASSVLLGPRATVSSRTSDEVEL